MWKYVKVLNNWTIPFKHVLKPYFTTLTEKVIFSEIVIELQPLLLDIHLLELVDPVLLSQFLSSTVAFQLPSNCYYTRYVHKTKMSSLQVVWPVRIASNAITVSGKYIEK